MKRIKLDKTEWEYDPDRPLGPEGGFGIVYWGTGKYKEEVAIKKLKIDAIAAAHRELKIAKSLVTRVAIPETLGIFDEV